MSVTKTISPPLAARNDRVVNENTKKLLDVIASIIADEYIRIATQNKDVFGGGK